MAAALTRNRATRTGQDGLQPVRFARDLYQIAELVELCFGSRLDASGRAAVRQMKSMGRLGPFLWLFAPFGLGLGSGYVWRSQGRVIGNVSLYRAGIHPSLGRGFLIANVAVAPEHRRQGIARMLMQAAMADAARKGSRWLSLQVEADNLGAIHMYETFGFERYETISQWETMALSPPDSLPAGIVRLRFPGERKAEAHLIFERARRGAMAWTRPISMGDIRDTLNNVVEVAGDTLSQHWVMPHAGKPQALDGALWLELSGWRNARLTLFLDPALEDGTVRRSLLVHALNLPALKNRRIRAEVNAGDLPVELLLVESGFKPTRQLLLMRKTYSMHDSQLLEES